jgi:hypothetical protein
MLWQGREMPSAAVGRYGYELPSWITTTGLLLTAVLVTKGLRPVHRRAPNTF